MHHPHVLQSQPSLNHTRKLSNHLWVSGHFGWMAHCEAKSLWHDGMSCRHLLFLGKRSQRMCCLLRAVQGLYHCWHIGRALYTCLPDKGCELMFQRVQEAQYRTRTNYWNALITRTAISIIYSFLICWTRSSSRFLVIPINRTLYNTYSYSRLQKSKLWHSERIRVAIWNNQCG